MLKKKTSESPPKKFWFAAMRLSHVSQGPVCYMPEKQLERCREYKVQVCSLVLAPVFVFYVFVRLCV